MLLDIFSVGISLHNIDQIDNQKIIDYVRKTSNKDNHKDNKDILSNPLFEDLNKVTQNKMEEFYSNTFKSNLKIELFQAWSNVADDKYITIPHTHNDAIVSAVYYPYCKEGEIIFLNPAGTSLLSQQKDWMIGEWNKYTNECFTVKVKTGHLIVFNSMLQHMVRCKDPKRVSIAYNGNPKAMNV